MNDRQIVSLLRELSSKKRVQHITEAVKAKMIANKIKMTREFKVIKEQYEAGLGPSMDIGSSAVPSSKTYTSGRALPSANVEGEYPDPVILASDLSSFDVDGNSEAARFIGLEDPATGPGTYQELLSNYRAALQAAESASRGAMSVEELIANFLMPGRSQDEMRQLRRAAARMLRSART